MKNLIKTNLKIGLDLDDTCNFWMSEYLKLFPKDTQDSKITKNVRKLCYKKEWWLNLPIKHRPDFEVELFCTKRISPKQYSYQWLKGNDFPIAPIYQVLYQKDKKSRFIKGRVDCFIDDSISNCIELNQAGIPCLLMDSPYNQSYGPIGRVFSLDYEEIMDTYEMFMYDVFKDYKDFILS